MIIKRLKISEEFPRFLCTFTPDTLDRRVNSTACVLTFRSCLYSDKEQAVEIFKVIFLYDNPIQSMHSRWFQNLVIQLSITIWKFLNSETFYYAVDPVNPTLTKRFTPDFESRFISFFTQLGSLFITLRQLSSLGLSLIDFLFQVSQDIHDCLLPGHSSFGDILKQPSWNESSRRDFSESKGWQT